MRPNLLSRHRRYNSCARICARPIAGPHRTSAAVQVQRPRHFSISLAAATRTWTPISGCFRACQANDQRAPNSTVSRKRFAELARRRRTRPSLPTSRQGDPSSMRRTILFLALALADAGADCDRTLASRSAIHWPMDPRFSVAVRTCSESRWRSLAGSSWAGAAGFGRPARCRWFSSLISIRSSRWVLRSLRPQRPQAGARRRASSTDLTPERGPKTIAPSFTRARNSRHHFSCGADVGRRTPAEDFCLLFRISLSYSRTGGYWGQRSLA